MSDSDSYIMELETIGTMKAKIVSVKPMEMVPPDIETDNETEFIDEYMETYKGFYEKNRSPVII